MERLDSVLFSSFVPCWERSTYPKCSAALLVKIDPPTPSLPLEKEIGNLSYIIINSVSLPVLSQGIMILQFLQTLFSLTSFPLKLIYYMEQVVKLQE